MRTLVQLSDLHFGRIDEQLLGPLAEAVRRVSPSVVVISGDLTQRARHPEFIAARAFLRRLPGPQIVIPGNHDIPLYNVFDRLMRPMVGFRHYIESEPMPHFIDEHIAVAGINTARSLVLKNGRIGADQLAALRRFFSTLPDELVKVVVTHHPLEAGLLIEDDELVGGAEQAMRAFADCGVDVLLSGHLHTSYSGDTGHRYALAGYEALAVSATTATSTRVRGETNGFNVLHLQKHAVAVERYQWWPSDKCFRAGRTLTFRRQAQGWEAA